MADLLTAKTLDEVVNAAAGPDQPVLRPMLDMLPVAAGSGTPVEPVLRPLTRRSPRRAGCAERPDR